jgi:hypothetical protein
MTTSTHRYHGYELVLYQANDDRYHVTIFDPKGIRISSTGTHLERQSALAEASRYVDHIFVQQRAVDGAPLPSKQTGGKVKAHT